MTISAPRLAAAALLLVGALVWILVNGPVEGRVLVVVTPQHGLTEADLLSFAAAGVAALLLITGRRPTRPAQANSNADPRTGSVEKDSVNSDS